MSSSQNTLMTLMGALSTSFEEDLRQVINLWERMGLSEAQVKQRQETVIAQLTTVTRNMVDEEAKNEVKLMSLCKNHLEKISSLWSELESDGEVFDKDLTSLPLLKREKYLRDKLDFLDKEKARRMNEERILIKENYDLSTLLGVKCISVVENTLLTDNERIELENHIGDLKEMREERETHMLNMKEEVLRLLDQLEIDLNATSLAEFMTEDESQSLTQADLRNLQVSMEELRKQLEEKQRGAEMLVDQICDLYDKLKVSEEQRLPIAVGQVCPINELHKSKHLPQLEEEMRNLREEKRKQIKVLIENAREELDELWEKCMTPEEDREEFLTNLQGYTEDTLEELETKIKVIKQFYNSNHDVFTKYKKLLSLWDSVRDLDAKSRDPNRLLKSRGNALFKEEKERKQISQLLPKIEQELLLLAEKKAAEFDEVLVIGKVPIVDIIENLRTEHAQQLKNISLDLKVANKSTNETTTLNNNKTVKSKTFLSGTLSKLRSTRMLNNPAASPGRRPNSPIAANLQRSRSRISPSPLTFSPARTKPAVGSSTRTLKVPTMAFNAETSSQDLSFHPDATSVMSSTVIGNMSVLSSKSATYEGESPINENASLKRKSPLNPASNDVMKGVKKSRFGFSLKRRSISLADETSNDTIIKRKEGTLSSASKDGKKSRFGFNSKRRSTSLADNTPTSRNNATKGEPSNIFHGGGGSEGKTGVRKGFMRSDSSLSVASQASTSGRSISLARKVVTSGCKYDSTSSLYEGMITTKGSSQLEDDVDETDYGLDIKIVVELYPKEDDSGGDADGLKSVGSSANILAAPSSSPAEPEGAKSVSGSATPLPSTATASASLASTPLPSTASASMASTPLPSTASASMASTPHKSGPVTPMSTPGMSAEDLSSHVKNEASCEDISIVKEEQLSDDPREWTVAQTLSSIIRMDPTIDPEDLQPIREQHIDGSALIQLTFHDIVTYYKIKVGPAIKVSKIIKTLQASTQNPEKL